MLCFQILRAHTGDQRHLRQPVGLRFEAQPHEGSCGVGQLLAGVEQLDFELWIVESQEGSVGGDLNAGKGQDFLHPARALRTDPAKLHRRQRAGAAHVPDKLALLHLPEPHGLFRQRGDGGLEVGRHQDGHHPDQDSDRANQPASLRLPPRSLAARQVHAFCGFACAHGLAHGGKSPRGRRRNPWVSARHGQEYARVVPRPILRL